MKSLPVRFIFFTNFFTEQLSDMNGEKVSKTKMKSSQGNSSRVKAGKMQGK
jgi:hypothetical protein